MPTDLERLVVSLEARIDKYEKSLRRAHGVADKQALAIERRFNRMNRRLNRIGQSAARSLIGPLSGVAAALSVREVTRYADAWTEAGNKIAAAEEIAGRQARSLESLNELASETRAPLEDTVDPYAKLSRATKDVAQSEEEVARATETVNKAFRAGGASVQEQVAGIRQIAQALASGFLQGDELRSIRENAPLIAQAIADEFETSIGGLKQLGAEGKLVTDRVFKAILDGQQGIDAAFKRTNPTIRDGITRVTNAMTQYIGQTDDSLQATERLTAGLTALADNFDNIADTTLQVAAIIAGALVGRAVGPMIAALGLGASATVKLVSAMVRAGSVMAAVRLGIAGISAAAGPLGLAIGAAATAFLLFHDSTSRAQVAADEHAKAMDTLEQKIRDTDKTSKAAVETTKQLIEARIKAAKAALEQARSELALGRGRLGASGSEGVPDMLGAAHIEGTSELEATVDARIKAIEALQARLKRFDVEVSTANTPRELPPTTANSKFEQDVEKIERRIRAMRLETEIIGKSAFQAERAQIAFELLEQAKHRGLAVTDELRNRVDSLSTAYAEASVELQRMEEAQEFLKSTASEVLKGFISDIRSGTDEMDAFRNGLDSIADKLIDMAINNLVANAFGGSLGAPAGAGGGSGGSSAGTIAALLFHRGGKAGSTAAPSRVVPSRTFANAPRLHDGLASNEMAAILKKNEFVLTPDQMRGVAGGGGRSVVEVRLSPELIAAILAEAEGQSVRVSNAAIGAAAPGIIQNSVQQVVHLSTVRPGALEG